MTATAALERDAFMAAKMCTGRDVLQANEPFDRLPSSARITPLAPEDAPAAARAFDAARLDGAGGGWTAAAIRTALGQDGFGKKASDGNGVLGAVLALASGDDAEIANLAVNAAARRRGLGHALVTAVLQEMRSRGYRRALLEVAADNRAAISVYRAMGFSDVGRRTGYYRRKNASIDATLMALCLGPDLKASE